jgi:hypothetical protein
MVAQSPRGLGRFRSPVVRQHCFLKHRDLPMDRYIHEQNLALYRKVLSETTEPVKRQTVLKLLAEEEASAGLPPQTGLPDARQSIG